MCEPARKLSFWSAELNYFRLALGFFSRIPMGKNVVYQPAFMHDCTRYFPLVGWLIAALLLGLFFVFEPLFGVLVSIVLVMIAGILLTGALHEDGLADTCDGFWGAYSSERKLEIMKDSRLGTYGASALICGLGLKFASLYSLAQQNALVEAMLVAYPLSRACALTYVQDMQYVSKAGATNKSDPLVQAVSGKHLAFVLFTGSMGLVVLPLEAICAIVVALVSMRYALYYWMKRHIGGFTGDTLGAAQQIFEITLYLVVLVYAQDIS